MAQWNARWIGYKYDPREDLGVFAFRRVFQVDGDSEPPLREGPSSSRGGGRGWGIRVSADNRYKLYCNGRLVGIGPQRGDERHWFFETYDVTPFLQEGENELVALVWNFGWMAPMAQHTVRTAFVCDGGDDLSTPNDWQVARVLGWDFAMMHNGVGDFYIDVGPGEIVDGRALAPPLREGPSSSRGGGRGVGKDPDLDLDLTHLDWHQPNVICQAEDRGSNGGGTPWMLIPATLPHQRYELRSNLPLSANDRVAGKPAPVPSGGVGGGATPELPLAPMNGGERGLGGDGRQPSEFALAPNQPLLLDFQELLCAYPRIHVSGPAGTELHVTYAESLWLPGTNDKGNRNETEGKEIRGYQDRFILSGGDDVFEPLWWRTFRFMEIQLREIQLREIQLREGEAREGEALASQISQHREDEAREGEALASQRSCTLRVDAFETGYPYAVESSFEADDPWVKPIWDVAVRTAERCAGETYFDCPYYEQLQYVGDSRIQALIGYYLGRDRRLPRNCIDQIGWSIMENGLTQSRYPSRQTQVIPPFSLWWVMMVYDQWLYDEDRLLNAETLPRDFSPLTHWMFSLAPPRRDHGDGPAFWNFGDWVPGWRWGVPPGSGASLMHELTFLMASTARSLMVSGRRRLEENQAAEREANPLSFFRDRWTGAPEMESEHAAALARVIQQLIGQNPDPWPTEALAAANAAKCTYYFSYYKHLAMFGGADQSHPSYLEALAPWKEQIESGLTTFAENPEPTRSDCHAWSAHPILGFFQIVAGVTSIAPGWKKARIAPHPGDLKRFHANIAHPDGDLRVLFENGTLDIDSPIPFTLHWQKKQEDFVAGRHQIG